MALTFDNTNKGTGRKKLSEASLEMARWVPTRVARTMLRVSRQRIYQLIRDGQLASMTYGGAVLISVKSIEHRLGVLHDGDN